MRATASLIANHPCRSAKTEWSCTIRLVPVWRSGRAGAAFNTAVTGTSSCVSSIPCHSWEYSAPVRHLLLLDLRTILRSHFEVGGRGTSSCIQIGQVLSRYTTETITQFLGKKLVHCSPVIWHRLGKKTRRNATTQTWLTWPVETIFTQAGTLQGGLRNEYLIVYIMTLLPPGATPR